MKKLVLMAVAVMGLFGMTQGFAQGYDNGCCEQPTGQCYCQYVTYDACPYTVKRCVQECYTVNRQCCNYVPQYYQVQRCRYVPEYYCETKCRYVPNYYCVPETRTCNRVVCEPRCNYVPRYYWKCENQCAPCAPACAPACAPSCS